MAELSAVSEFAADQLPALVATLAGGGQRAEARESLARCRRTRRLYGGGASVPGARRRRQARCARRVGSSAVRNQRARLRVGAHRKNRRPSEARAKSPSALRRRRWRSVGANASEDGQNRQTADAALGRRAHAHGSGARRDRVPAADGRKNGRAAPFAAHRAGPSRSHRSREQISAGRAGRLLPRRQPR